MREDLCSRGYTPKLPWEVERNEACAEAELRKRATFSKDSWFIIINYRIVKRLVLMVSLGTGNYCGRFLLRSQNYKTPSPTASTSIRGSCATINCLFTQTSFVCLNCRSFYFSHFQGASPGKLNRGTHTSLLS